MVTATEALSSSDPKIVKRLRGSICTQLSCDINILEKALSHKINNSFDFGKISPQLVKTQKAKLQNHFDLVQKLHEKYIEVREEGLNDDEEKCLVKEDIDYIEQLTSKVYPVLEAIEDFEENLSKHTKIKNL